MAVALAVVQESRSCSVDVTTDEQYLHGRPTVSSSDANASSTCGSVLHPWHLEAPAGQRINVSLLDFAGSANYRSRDDSAACRRYGYIVEKSSKKNVSICAAALTDGQKSQRESTVYLSDTNSLDIVLVNSQGVHNLVRLTG